LWLCEEEWDGRGMWNVGDRKFGKTEGTRRHGVDSIDVTQNGDK